MDTVAERQPVSNLVWSSPDEFPLDKLRIIVRVGALDPVFEPAPGEHIN